MLDMNNLKRIKKDIDKIDKDRESTFQVSRIIVKLSKRTTI